MKYFSTFSGIGGFELGIYRAFDKQFAPIEQDRKRRYRTTDEMGSNVLSTGWSSPLCVGYSEIDKYAIKVYEKQFGDHKNYGETQADLDNIKTILKNKNYDILELCYVNTAKQNKSFIKTTSQSVENALNDTSLNGDNKISQLINATNESIELCSDKKCSICMGMNAPVVVNKNQSSLLLNTEMVTDISTGNNMELAICINSPSKFSDQKNTKSYATTVITQKEGMAYAHINTRKPTPNFGDITKINTDELPDFDVLVGGFPCQAFSIAGKRRGFEDTRGTLFFELARILKAKTPRLFVFENVKGLLNHDSGNTFKTIIAAIDELGYDCQWQVLNSKNHGVPQNRERVIIVGHLRGTPRPQVFPLTGSGEQTSKSVEVAGTLETDGWEKRFEQIRRVHSTGGISPTIPTAQGGGVMTKIAVKAIAYHNNRNISTKTENCNSLTSSFRGHPDGDGRPAIMNGSQVRRLTPMECERLQGFPDNWTKFGVGDEPISDSQRYKMCGNAVTTNVIQAVFERIFNKAIDNIK